MSKAEQTQANQAHDESATRKARKPLALKVLLGLAGLIAACAIAFFVYVGDYYHADETAVAALSDTSEVSVIGEAGSCDIVFMPQDPKAALIFYPGGKVEYTAYAPLMQDLAKRGIACVLVEMPFNLAVFDIGAADDARTLAALESLPSDIPWFIGGHSLGGSMAAAHLGANADDFAGLVLLASYSTEDLSGRDLKVISVYGSEDIVLNTAKYAENYGNLGKSVFELVIEGGNHAQFGSYGAQAGDGVAAISAEEQRQLTADFVAEAILS